jgi:hypothetical protein
MRYNSEGIRREELIWTLGQARFVLNARKLDSCLLCRRNGVNEAGLCTVCWSSLDDEEYEAAKKWTSGVMPDPM